MAFSMDLSKDNNSLHHDFLDAYWMVDHLRFENAAGENYTLFSLLAFPSRESRLAQRQEVASTLDFGGPSGEVVDSVLYRWDAVFKTDLIFPLGIPIQEAEQKDALYPFVIAYLELTDYEPVFEPGQQGGEA